MAALKRVQADVGFDALQYDDQIGKVSLIGAGMRSTPASRHASSRALAATGVNIEMISHVGDPDLGRHPLGRRRHGGAAVHSAFGLDADRAEAVVYGGTGR